MAIRHDLYPSERRPPTGDDLADLQAQFDECDADGDQRIDLAEFARLLENLGSEVAPEHRRERFEEIDRDRDGTIVRSAFMAWWHRF